MYYPSLEQVRELAKEGNLIPVYREISADLETPVTAYMKVARKPYSFLLESIEGGERLARYSFIGTEPSKVIRTGPGQPDGEVDPLRLVEQALGRFKVVSIPGLPRFHGGHVGFLAYDAVHYFEPRVPPPASNPLDLPESTFMLADTLLVFDHLRQKIQVVSHAHIRGNNVDAAYAKATKRIDRLVKRLDRPLKRPKRNGNREDGAERRERRTYTSNRSYEEYDEIVRRSRDYIIAGDIIQVVPSQRLERPTDAAPLDLYRALRGTNPSPYMYLLELDDFHIIGASPELLVRVEDGLVLNFPLAGTRRRGRNQEEDEALAEELRTNEKERAEHIMLVDLGRNDVGRVAIPGTVEVHDLMRVVKYSHVMHLESEVHGQLRPDRTIYDALRSCLPAGTLSGRAEGAGNGDHRGAGGRGPGRVRRRRGLLQLLRQHGHGHHHPHHGAEGRRGLHPGGRRHRLRQRAGGGVPGDAAEGGGAAERHQPGGGTVMILLLDNYDSFTYNLYQYLCELGADVHVERNDQITVDAIEAMRPEKLVVSPGPCTPKEAGVSMEAIERLGPTTPVLGVCLGHQCIGEVYGGTVGGAGEIVHGKTSAIHHTGVGVLTGLPSPFEAIRYHSLVVFPEDLPDSLEVTAWTDSGKIMGLKHREYPVEGVQFHPESIMTAVGKDLLRNFLAM